MLTYIFIHQQNDSYCLIYTSNFYTIYGSFKHKQNHYAISHLGYILKEQ